MSLNINKDSQIILKFFGEDELYAEDRKLEEILKKTLDIINIVYNRIAILTFKNGLVMAIELLDFDGFKITISNPDLYEYRDNSETKMSRDRVIHYISYVANHVFLEI